MTTIAVGENIKDPLSRFAESWSRKRNSIFHRARLHSFSFPPFFFLSLSPPFFPPREIPPPLAWSYVFLRRLKSKPRSTINIFPLSFPETSRHFFPLLRFHIFHSSFFSLPLPHYSFFSFFFFESVMVITIQIPRRFQSILKRVCCQGRYSEQLFPIACYHRSVLVYEIYLETTFVRIYFINTSIVAQTVYLTLIFLYNLTP